jgi:hypothetical protein
MSALDTSIDDLYQQPLNDFTQARNTLAKSLSGAEAKRVRALAKPTLVPWAVNQVYWRARGAYDRLMKSGERLRTAQIAALEGRNADVRAATETHRSAIADAVREAERLAATAGSKPSPDALARSFEALSLATGSPEPPGRLTQPLQPAGFEALAGVKPQAGPAKAGHYVPSRSVRLHADRDGGTSRPESHQNESPGTKSGRSQRGDSALVGVRASETKREREEARLRAAEAKRADLARQKRDAAVKAAEAVLARAEAEEQRARATWERAHDELLAARRSVFNLKSAT